MHLFRKTNQLVHWITGKKKDGKKIGFVPTMGALHQGHLSLMKLSLDECDITVVSIFVNPKQFNDPADLKRYPRPLENDILLVIKESVDVLFIPETNEIYPAGEQSRLDFIPGNLATTMEAKFRPGHFEGVAEVVYRLLQIVSPDYLYMGQKDFQQLTIIRKLITDLHLPVHLVMGPTIREENGLAMSSRNELLSADGRWKAGIIYQTLFDANRKFDEGGDLSNIKMAALASLSQEGFAPEYFEVVDGVTLRDIQHPGDSNFIVACCAVKLEGVRLIDNLIWKTEE